MKPTPDCNKRNNPFSFLGALIICLTIGVFSAGSATAAGLLIADGGFGGILEIKEHDVQVTINNGVAVTQVTQVFHNTENRQLEALYTFPLPKHASVANFSMWINGKEMVGEVLEKKRAREIYNSYKRKRRDPGLLEQVDYKSFELRVYPINPGADQKIQVTYYQELDTDHNEATYVYPLATATRKSIDSQTKGRFAISFEVKSAIPIASVVSPSHGDEFVMVDHSDTYKMASLETNGGSLARDVVITYGLSRPKTGVDLITSRQQGEDGYFCLTMTTGKELEALDRGMDYVFLLDVSGSMAHDGKLIISRQSVASFIDELGDKDRFEVMSFSVKPTLAFGAIQPATVDLKEQAKQFLDANQARGGTTLAPALSTAYKYSDPDRTLNVIILSDGMTEQQESATLMAMISSRPRNARVFCIGVGNEVNRPLLEQMAEETGGLAAFISRGDDFKRQAKAFRRKLAHPVVSDIGIEFQGITVYDVEPAQVPNLYHGAPIRIYGRYKESGEAQMALNGGVLGKELRQTVPLEFPEVDPDNPEIERMWAWKRVDSLLKAADKTGARTNIIDEVIRLGETYSIVTEYTSFLVLENNQEYQRWKIERRNVERLTRDRKAQTRRSQTLAAIRNVALDDIGPQMLEKKLAANTPPKPNTIAPPAASPQPTPDTPRRQSRNVDIGFGSGPVGPLFVGAAYWLKRRKRSK